LESTLIRDVSARTIDQLDDIKPGKQAMAPTNGQPDNLSQRPDGLWLTSFAEKQCESGRDPVGRPRRIRVTGGN
jgi:hypothetical protein